MVVDTSQYSDNTFSRDTFLEQVGKEEGNVLQNRLMDSNINNWEENNAVV